EAVSQARILPNRLQAPLTRDEQLAEQYIDQPSRLLELAELTGNRGLRAVAFGMVRREQKNPALGRVY
ncbi:MAG TPA: hypothetical protein PK620_04900, partial [Denitromonas sp.]|nr:hypothetical protein [Denitromonas sp.]